MNHYYMNKQYVFQQVWWNEMKYIRSLCAHIDNYQLQNSTVRSDLNLYEAYDVCVCAYMFTKYIYARSAWRGTSKWNPKNPSLKPSLKHCYNVVSA